LGTQYIAPGWLIILETQVVKEPVVIIVEIQ